MVVGASGPKKTMAQLKGTALLLRHRQGRGAQDWEERAREPLKSFQQ